MVLNFAFLDGMYNGSTVSIRGRNPYMEAIREMPVVGGSGVFQYARGYALMKTFSMSTKTGYAVGMLLNTMCLCCTTERVTILYHIILVRDMVSKFTRNSFVAFSFMVCVAFHEYMLCWFRIYLFIF